MADAEMAGDSPRILSHPQGTVEVQALPGGRRRIDVRPHPSDYCHLTSCQTAYPLDLIEAILRVTGPAYLCEEIRRDEDPDYVERDLRHDILSFVGEEEFSGKRILDFGCGSGASTAILGRLLPAAQIVGVELEKEKLAIAERRAGFYRNTNVRFLQSPDGNSLPPDLGRVDFVVLSAVYEHLLPGERPVLLRQLWEVLEPGGVLFLDQTPHRWWFLEGHTTTLPLINYLPDRLALGAARRFSPRISREADWPHLLRAGIRGGTRRAILGQLRAAGAGWPELLAPTRLGHRDLLDVWYATSSYETHPRLKSALRPILKAIHRLTGIVWIPTLTLAIRKQPA